MKQSRLGDGRILFTVGYEGRDLPSFLELLRDEGVERVVDVRDNPWSRKPGFTKGPLRDALSQAGVMYEHVGALGLPREIRRAVKEGRVGSFEASYREHLEENEEAMDGLRELAEDERCAIMCMERRVEDCHRRFLAERFREEGWRIVHL